MEEAVHIVDVLTRARHSLEQEDTKQLRDLSDQTIHSASVYQHTDYILVAIIIYVLSKMVERKDKIKISNWQQFIKDINNLLALSISAIQRKKYSLFVRFLVKTKNYIENSSQDLRPMIQELLRKASINKASKIYEHGISLTKTTRLLGISPWELSEYIGEKENTAINLNKTLDVKSRVDRAMEFFN